MTTERTAKAVETEYVVLAWTSTGTADEPNGGYWTELPETYRARNANDAIKQAAAKHALETMAQTGREGAFLYVAIPSRSWQPKSVTPKVETTFEIEDGAWGSTEEPS